MQATVLCILLDGPKNHQQLSSILTDFPIKPETAMRRRSYLLEGASMEEAVALGRRNIINDWIHRAVRSHFAYKTGDGCYGLTDRFWRVFYTSESFQDRLMYAMKLLLQRRAKVIATKDLITGDEVKPQEAI